MHCIITFLYKICSCKTFLLSVYIYLSAQKCAFVHLPYLLVLSMFFKPLLLLEIRALKISKHSCISFIVQPFCMSRHSNFANTSLPDDIKLPLLTGSTLQRAVSLAGAWARSKFSNMPPVAQELMMSGAMVCVMFGISRKINGQPDGDWVPIPAPPAESETWEAVPQQTYSIEALRTALTVVVATKANWWLTNHHTGQGAPSGYVLKVLSLKFPGADMAALTTAAHTLGHWASTLHCLNVARIPGVRPIEPFEYANANRFELAPDALFKIHRAACWHSKAKGGMERNNTRRTLLDHLYGQGIIPN
ncbi:uncharacterized protein [Bemisia tabaci]|uniref:uncharacterized protein n=1 Tax=Bemisia tabaci TaxID=7038 RepID=UPI003B2814E2